MKITAWNGKIGNCSGRPHYRMPFWSGFPGVWYSKCLKRTILLLINGKPPFCAIVAANGYCQRGFNATVPARSSRSLSYLLYDIEKAQDVMYQTDLRVQEAPGLQIDNNRFTVTLNLIRGIDPELVLSGWAACTAVPPDETNGRFLEPRSLYSRHAPGRIPPDWAPPAHVQQLSGPLYQKWSVGTYAVPEADASLRCSFSGVPYFTGNTTMRINQTINCLAFAECRDRFQRKADRTRCLVWCSKRFHRIVWCKEHGRSYRFEDGNRYYCRG